MRGCAVTRRYIDVCDCDMFGVVCWYFGSIRFRGELGFLNCDDVCMRVFDESFELLEFVVYAVYVNLQNDEISLVITARFMNACGVCTSSALSFSSFEFLRKHFLA